MRRASLLQPARERATEMKRFKKHLEVVRFIAVYTPLRLENVTAFDRFGAHDPDADPRVRVRRPRGTAAVPRGAGEPRWPSRPRRQSDADHEHPSASSPDRGD